MRRVSLRFDPYFGVGAAVADADFDVGRLVFRAGELLEPLEDDDRANVVGGGGGWDADLPAVDEADAGIVGKVEGGEVGQGFEAGPAAAVGLVDGSHRPRCRSLPPPWYVVGAGEGVGVALGVGRSDEDGRAAADGVAVVAAGGECGAADLCGGVGLDGDRIRLVEGLVNVVGAGEAAGIPLGVAGADGYGAGRGDAVDMVGTGGAVVRTDGGGVIRRKARWPPRW